VPRVTSVVFVLIQLWTARRVCYFAAENVAAVDRWIKGLLEITTITTQLL